MAKQLTPLGDRVVVIPVERDEKTPGGLVLPVDSQEPQHEGTVIAVGDGVKVDVGLGCVVLYSKYGGLEVDLDGRKALILAERDLLAVVA